MRHRTPSSPPPADIALDGERKTEPQNLAACAQWLPVVQGRTSSDLPRPRKEEQLPFAWRAIHTYNGAQEANGDASGCPSHGLLSVRKLETGYVVSGMDGSGSR